MVASAPHPDRREAPERFEQSVDLGVDWQSFLAQDAASSSCSSGNAAAMAGSGMCGMLRGVYGDARPGPNGDSSPRFQSRAAGHPQRGKADRFVLLREGVPEPSQFAEAQLRLVEVRCRAYPRRKVDGSRVAMFEDVIQSGGPGAVPPIEVINDGAGGYTIVEGVHRSSRAKPRL